jgi:hypothetical protein
MRQTCALPDRFTDQILEKQLSAFSHQPSAISARNW